MTTRKQYGSAAHLIVSPWCRFHLTTEIGGYVVSTVGEYMQPGHPDEYTDIGYDRKYETMVFRVDGRCLCGCGLPSHNGVELAMSGYNDATAANAGHEKTCVDYEEIVAQETRDGTLTTTTEAAR